MERQINYADFRSELRLMFFEEIIAPRSRAPGFAYGLAKNYALLKDQQQALNWLEKSYENKEFFLPFVKTDPVFSDLHSQPRYQEILRKMNLN